jgi:hypothetical protein
MLPPSSGSVLKMEATSSEKLVSTYRIQCHNPEDSNMNDHCCKYYKTYVSYKNVMFHVNIFRISAGKAPGT